MAYPQGINFRGTSGYVTDGTNHDYELGATYGNYPRTTAQGNNVGWEAGPFITAFNRTTSYDVRLAGVNYSDGSGTGKFRMDLPSSGSYNIRFAAGDNYFYSRAVDWALYDGTTKLRDLTTGTTSGADRVKDATNTEYTSTNWPGSNSAITETFAGTIIRVQDDGTSNYIVHVYVEAGAAATKAPPPSRNQRARIAPLMHF